MALDSADDLTDTTVSEIELKKASSSYVHKALKEATGFGLTQSITKWLIIEENEQLLSAKFICIRWSQTKGFIVLKNENKDDEFILYVDLLGAMNSLLQSQNNGVNDWLTNNFTLHTKKKESDDEKEKGKGSRESHKIIKLKQLYDILSSNWGPQCIKVADHKKANGVIEWRVVSTKKKRNNFYQSLDDLFNLLEIEEAEEEKQKQKQKQERMLPMDEWLKTNPKCLALSKDVGIDVNLTINAMDDSVVSGQIFLIYDERDGSLFLTIQYEINNKKQVKFAREYLKEFGLDDDNIIHSEMLNMKTIIQLIQHFLKENKLTIRVSDEYRIHQEILFVVKEKMDK